MLAGIEYTVPAAGAAAVPSASSKNLFYCPSASPSLISHQSATTPTSNRSRSGNKSSKRPGSSSNRHLSGNVKVFPSAITTPAAAYQKMCRDQVEFC